MNDVAVAGLPPDAFDPTIGSRRAGGFAAVLDRARSQQGERTLWHVNPDTHDKFGRAIAALITDAPEQERLGAVAHARVVDRYLAPDHLSRYLELAGSL